MKNQKLFILGGLAVLLILIIGGIFLLQNNEPSNKVNVDVVNQGPVLEPYEPMDPDLATPLEELSEESLREALLLIEL